MKKIEVKQFNPFEKLYNRELAESEINEIRHNLLGFVELLLEIDKEQKKR